MKSTLLDFSTKKIDPRIIEAYRRVDKCAGELAIPYLVIGATARDLVWHYGFDLKIRRMTTDIDFAIQVKDWETFQQLRAALEKEGFKSDRAIHRLNFQETIPIDIVPFGDLANKDAKIEIPPENSQMIVLGFYEALIHAYQVKLAEDLEVKVASAEGLVLLKLISWTDRPYGQHKKDAYDLAYIFNEYESINKNGDMIYEDDALFERFDGDTRRASVFLLGERISEIASEQSQNEIKNVILGINPKNTIEFMKHEMKDFPSIRTHQLLDDFISGFIEKSAKSNSSINS